MTTEYQKILFAEIYKMADTLKAECKSIEKLNGEAVFMDGEAEWERISRTMNTIVTSATLAERISREITARVDLFLRNGPYEGESAGLSPMEALAREAE